MKSIHGEANFIVLWNMKYFKQIQNEIHTCVERERSFSNKLNYSDNKYVYCVMIFVGIQAYFGHSGLKGCEFFYVYSKQM